LPKAQCPRHWSADVLSAAIRNGSRRNRQRGRNIFRAVVVARGAGLAWWCAANHVGGEGVPDRRLQAAFGGRGGVGDDGGAAAVAFVVVLTRV